METLDTLETYQSEGHNAKSSSYPPKAIVSVESIESVVSEALKSKIPESEIVFLSNHKKYSSENSGQQKVFELMAQINKAALQSGTLCTDAEGQQSFQDALNETIDFLTEHLRGKKIHFVELGPEPVKTDLIIQKLTEVSSVLYTGIDINESSRQVMHDAIVKHIDTKDFEYIINNYHDQDLLFSDTDCDIRIITMLGFQEGNEFPHIIGEMLDKFGKAPAILISEHHVRNQQNSDNLLNFYHLDEMKEFSDVVAEMFGTSSNQPHEVHLLPVVIDKEEITVAVTTKQLDFEVGNNRHLITNINLKPTRMQLRLFRSKYSMFSEMEFYESGDRSVAFQVSSNFNLD